MRSWSCAATRPSASNAAATLIYDDEAALLQSTRDARRDLEKLFAADISGDDGIIRDGPSAEPPVGPS